MANLKLEHEDVRVSTTECKKYGHPELSWVMRGARIAGVERLLLDLYESEVAKGKKFTPGKTLRLGWRTLRLVAGDGDDLSITERDLGDRSRWVPGAEHSLMETWFQRAIAESVNRLDRVQFPNEGQGAAICSELANSSEIMMSRTAIDEHHSGWVILCAGRNHVHGDDSVKTVELFEVAQSLPFLTQFFALPDDLTVLIQPNGTVVPGEGPARATIPIVGHVRSRIRAELFDRHSADPLPIRVGSYWAVLNEGPTG